MFGKGLAQKIDDSANVENVGIVLSDEQINCIAMMTAQGYTARSIMHASGLTQSGDYELALQNELVQKQISELKSEKVTKEIENAGRWDVAEELALEAVIHDITYSSSEMSPMEKLRIAKEANTAKRKTGDEALRNGSNVGQLDGDLVNGNKQVINLSLPTVVINRFKQLSENNGAIIEAEAVEQKEFEGNNKEILTPDDVQDILKINLNENNNSDMFSPSGQELFNSVFDEDSNIGISDAEG